MGYPEQLPVRPPPPDQLQANRQPLRGEPGRHRQGGEPCCRDQVRGRHPVQVGFLRHPVDLVHPVQVDIERGDLNRRAREHVDAREELADLFGEPVAQHGGATQLGRGQLQAALDVPDHVRSESRRVVGKQRPIVRREPERPQDPEHLIGARQIG